MSPLSLLVIWYRGDETWRRRREKIELVHGRNLGNEQTLEGSFDKTIYFMRITCGMRE